MNAPHIGTAFARPSDPDEDRRAREITSILTTIPNPRDWILAYIDGCIRYRIDDADAVAKIGTASRIYTNLRQWNMLRG
jgi:hypothetical protein